jgi:hypothetical protein
MFSSWLCKTVLSLPFSFGLMAETLPPVMLTSLPHGYAQTVVSSYSQRCTSNFPTGPSNCTLIGDPKLLLNRGGTPLDRAGNTYFINNYVDLNLLDEHGGLQPATIVPFTTISPAETSSCTITGSEGLKLSQVIWTTSFNAPLNLLNVITANVHYSFHNIVPFPGTTPSLTCFPGDTGYGFANITSMSVVTEVTYALIRITGPFPQGKQNNGQGNQGNGKGDQ